MDMSEVQSHSSPPSDTCLQSELQVVCRAFDRGLDHKWENFCTEFKQLWGQFQKECIQSSQKLVLAEKEAADVRYDTILSDFNGMKTKLGDLERYNQLLQEKLDSTQEEMKSLSAVSMTIQWEKRVATKQAECQRLTQQVEKLQKMNTTLKRENTLLNTQLEQWNHEESLRTSTHETVESTLKEASVETPVLDTTESQPNESSEQSAPPLDVDAAAEHTDQAPVQSDTATTDDLSTQPEPTLCDSKDTQESHTKHSEESTEHAPDAFAPSAENDTEVPLEPKVEVATAAKTDVSPNEETTNPPSMTNVKNDTTEVPKASSSHVAEPPVEQANAQPPVPDSGVDAPEVATEESQSLANDAPNEGTPAITYTLKKLKRRKTDDSKTTYLLGSNNVLYTWTENDQPGEEVGVKSARGYKFHKK